MERREGDGGDEGNVFFVDGEVAELSDDEECPRGAVRRVE